MYGRALYLLGKPELRAFFVSLKKMLEQNVSLVLIHPDHQNPLVFAAFLSWYWVILLLGTQRFKIVNNRAVL